MQNQFLGAYIKENPETTEALERINRLDDMLQEILITQGVIPVEQGDMQISDAGIGAQGMVEAPSSVDAMGQPMQMPNNFGEPPKTANDKDHYGRV